MDMDKKELTERVAYRGNVGRTEVETILGHVLDEIGDALERGDSVVIPRFGTFEIRHRGARKGRNPQTGAEIDIAASKAPAFKPAAALKRRVSE
jgi:DNA-binding protein HU-beta